MLAPFAPTWRRRGAAIVAQEAGRRREERGDGYGAWPVGAVGSGMGGGASSVCMAAGMGDQVRPLGRCSRSCSTSWDGRSHAREADTETMVGRAGVGRADDGLTM